MLWDIYQQTQIHAAQASNASTARKTGEVRESLRALEKRTDRLALTTMAIWSLMSEKLGVTEAELEAKVQEIDLADGKLDGKVSIETNSCASCNRKLSKRHDKCMYCGAETNRGMNHL